MANRKNTCQRLRCSEPPFLGGLCKEHHNLAAEQKTREDEASHCLHNSLPLELNNSTAVDLMEESQGLQKRWDRVCGVVKSQRGVESMPLDEAEYAVEWCISLAIELIAAIEAVEAGSETPPSLEHTRGWVMERFANLDSGLRSNGTRLECSYQQHKNPFGGRD